MEAGKTLGETARYVGVSTSYLSDVELLRRKPMKADLIVRAASLFRCDASYLMGLATRERGAVNIQSEDPMVLEAAALLARTTTPITQRTLCELQRLLGREEDDVDA